MEQYPVEYQAIDYPQQEEEAFPLLDYVQLLWFRRRLIIVITILASVIGYIQVNQLKNVYTATSSNPGNARRSR